MTPQLQPSLPNSNINNSFGTNPFSSTQTQFLQSSAGSNNNSANLAASSVIIGDPSWYLDSGATNHVIVDGQSLLQQFDYNGKNKLLVGNKQELNIFGIGNTVIMSCLSTVSYPIHLKEVLVVPQIAKNLLSVSKLTHDNDLVVEFFSDQCLIKHKQLGIVVLRAVLEEGLYKLDVQGKAPQRLFLTSLKTLHHTSDSNEKKCVLSGILSKSVSESTSSPSAYHSNVDINILHQRLGHSSLPVLQKVVSLCKNNNFSNQELSFCEACQLRKQHMAVFPSSSGKTSEPLELIHSDMWDQHQIWPSINICSIYTL